MISNERSWPHLRPSAPRPAYQSSSYQPSSYHQSSYQSDYQQPPRPHVEEDTLKTMEIQVERKFFILTLKENIRGRFLRITEEVGGKRNTIIIPSTGLDDFQRVMTNMVQAAEATPPPVVQAATPDDPDAIGNR